MRTIFVFGSNREGRHGKGTALEAIQAWGAKYGQAEGLQGDSYAIITKELRKSHPKVTLSEIKISIHRFLGFAIQHPELHFVVSAIGCGLAGFTPLEIAPLFLPVLRSKKLSNVELPKEFSEVLAQYAV